MLCYGSNLLLPQIFLRGNFVPGPQSEPAAGSRSRSVFKRSGDVVPCCSSSVPSNHADADALEIIWISEDDEEDEDDDHFVRGGGGGGVQLYKCNGRE